MKSVKQTPWPIENRRNPLVTPRNIGYEVSELPVQDVAAEVSGSARNVLANGQEGMEMSQLEFARECFRDPQTYRDMVLRHVRIESREQFEGKSVFYMWMDKACPVGCDFCFFQSPALTEKSPQTAITPEGIEKLITYVNDANISQMFISGGGEPMLKKQAVNRLIQGVSVEEVIIITSSHWSQTPEGTQKTLSDLRRSVDENPKKPAVTVRLSLDRFHYEKLSKGRGFEYAKNLINEFSTTYANDKSLRLKVHTMNGDDTIDKLLAELPVAKREDSGGYLKQKSKITLENGYEFSIEFSQEFQTDAEIDMKENAQAVGHNVDSFQEFIDVRRNGNMSLSFNGDQPKGVYWLMLYDGTMLVWGATAPDIETSLYRDSYADTMKRNRADVLTLGVLEKGTFHRENIVNEVNPGAVTRARGMGLRDFHARASLEEPTTRLYASLRMIQDYVAEGRITPEQMQGWPAEVRKLVETPKETLVQAYGESGQTIVRQMLGSPDVNADALLALYKRVGLGHYAPLTQQEFAEEVAASAVDEAIRVQFFASALNVQTQRKSLPIVDEEAPIKTSVSL
jgi:uncharacterized Fe-S cluster-containing radical SAM superfamily protein